MCGIVGYVGRRSAAPVLLSGLKKLEYRGYDSAGVAVLHDGIFDVVKRKGRVWELDGAERLHGKIGIGHTRWATHGEPSERNAHPHLYGKFAVVHNGIVENFHALKEECLLRGEIFSSDTDSEIIAHLVSRYYEGDFLKAVFLALSRLVGSYAIAALCLDVPDRMIVARMKSPLIVGVGEGETIVASDLPAVAGMGIETYSLSDGELAEVSADGALFYDCNLASIKKERIAYSSEEETPTTGAFPHFMFKEIFEIPTAVARTLTTQFPPALTEILRKVDRIEIAACGTAYHSGISAKYAIESLARVPVSVHVASEFRYSDPILTENTLVIAVSQSGETADTIAAARLAKERNVTVLAITNVFASSLTETADFTLYTRAGCEIAVAATKSFNAQLALLYLFACRLAQAKGRPAADTQSLVNAVTKTLQASQGVAAWAKYFTDAKSAYFLGRGADFGTAVEGSLKLKEISYLPGEGYPAGELKHGTLALVGEETPVVVILTQRAIAEKTMNAVHETQARGATVFLITSLEEYAAATEHVLLIPQCTECFSPILSVIPLQLLAYHTAVAMGRDPDKPRNLAKSVTVE